jgi:hypothetical protein
MSTSEKNVDLSVTAAKRQTWEKNNARAVVKEVMDEMPDADSEARFHVFYARAHQFDTEIYRYFHDNAERALRVRKGESVDRTKAREQAAKDLKLFLLDLMLPNGKMLRDCTFSEAGRAGGWYTRLSKCGQPGEIIGATMTEKEVRAVWKSD